jgi:pimeloyl-ACP methyl ester carboxylesterase
MATIFALLLAMCTALPAQAAHLRYGWQEVDGVQIFYREGGDPGAATLVLLHGAPASSIQYDELMQRLTDLGELHVIAMDYPSFGYSAAPQRDAYAYTFDHLALTVEHFLQARHIVRFSLYMQDFGLPVGMRLFSHEPARVSALIVQNAVMHLDGFAAAQDPRGELQRHWAQRNPAFDQRRISATAQLKFPSPQGWDETERMNPDAILLMTASQRRPGVVDARNDLWFDYGSNVAQYPQWQSLVKSTHVPVMVLWGTRDDFFTTPGAVAYLRDAPWAEIHLLDSIHFASLDVPEVIAPLANRFLDGIGSRK